MRWYNCHITSNNCFLRVYHVNTSSAMWCAKEFGRCESGEAVTVYAKSGKPVSRVLWSSEHGGHYVRVKV